MLYPLIEASRWSETYGLEITEKPCLKCGKQTLLSIPFAESSLRGFLSEDHGCGEEYQMLLFKDVSKDGADYWKRFC